jgi:hypothetical protein
MTYNADLTWSDLAITAGRAGKQLSTSLREALAEYDEWQSFRAGRTNAQIATALSRTESEVADLDACFAAFKELYDYSSDYSPRLKAGASTALWRRLASPRARIFLAAFKSRSIFRPQ